MNTFGNIANFCIGTITTVFPQLQPSISFVDYTGGLGTVNNIDVYTFISERIHSYDTSDNNNIFSGKLDIINIEVSSKTYHFSYHNTHDDKFYTVETIYCVITINDVGLLSNSRSYDWYFTLDFGQAINIYNDYNGSLFVEPNYVRPSGLIVTSIQDFVDILSIERSSHNVSDAIAPYINQN